LKPNVKDLADGHSTKIVMKLVFFSSDRNTSFYIWLESRLILKLDLLRKCVQNTKFKVVVIPCKLLGCRIKFKDDKRDK